MQRNKSAAVADQCVAEYFKAKKARLEVTSVTGENDKKEALKMFLLSLMPELQEFRDSQIKTFKRRVFTVIDEISNATDSQCQPTFCASLLPSPHSAYSNTSVTSMQSPVTSPSPGLSVRNTTESRFVTADQYYTGFGEDHDLTNII